MIHIITDTLPGEPEILPLLRYKELRITDLDGNSIYVFPAPASGWTHEALVAKTADLFIFGDGRANAYLETVWIGSTEV